MAKKSNSKKIESKKINNEYNMLTLIKIVIVVTVIFLVFYGLTIIIKQDKKNPESENKTPVTIQYNEILIGNIFDQNNDNYYVLIEDNDDIQVQVYETYLNQYSKKENAKRVYTAKLNNMFNKQYISEEINLSDNIVEFKVSGTTLLEISNKKIVNSYKNKAEIIELLKSITKED